MLGEVVMNMIKSIKNMTKTEKIIWITSLTVIIVSSFLSTEIDVLTVIASLVGATALIFVGKGDAIGQLLTILRSPFCAVAYAANDVILITLWVLATMENTSYFPMVICFVIFLINDLYGFYNWRRMKVWQMK